MKKKLLTINLQALAGRWYYSGAYRNACSPQSIEILCGRSRYSTQLAEVRDQEVLVVGDSYGWFAEFALKAGAKSVQSIDIAEPSPYLAVLAQQHANFNHQRCSILEFDERERYDLCVYLEVIEHLPVGSELPSLQRIRVALRPHGCLLLSTPIRSVLSYLSDPACVLGHRHYTLAALDRLLQTAGYQRERWSRGGYLWSALDMWLLYLNKWILRRPYQSRLQQRLDAEYPHPQGTTLFILASPT